MSSPSAGKRRMDTDVIKLYPLLNSSFSLLRIFKLHLVFKLVLLFFFLPFRQFFFWVNWQNCLNCWLKVRGHLTWRYTDDGSQLFLTSWLYRSSCAQHFRTSHCYVDTVVPNRNVYNNGGIQSRNWIITFQFLNWVSKNLLIFSTFNFYLRLWYLKCYH